MERSTKGSRIRAVDPNGNQNGGKYIALQPVSISLFHGLRAGEPIVSKV